MVELLLTCWQQQPPFAAPASSSSAGNKSVSGSALGNGVSGGVEAGSEEADMRKETGRWTWVLSQTAAGADHRRGRMQTGCHQKKKEEKGARGSSVVPICWFG